MPRFRPCLAVAASLPLAACAVVPPSGPSVMAMPGKDKSFAAFQEDDGECRAYAAWETGPGPAQAATNNAVGSTVLGTAVGAAAGAALGAAGGHAGPGAAIGAGAGLLMGAASGAGNARLSATELQRRYDMRYVQCMAAKGESVPAPVPAAAGPGVAYPAYPYSYPYPYAYPYPAYPYPGPVYYGPPVGVGVVIGGYGHRHW